MDLNFILLQVVVNQTKIHIIMASVIDVKTLSKEEQYQLVLDILKHNSELRSKVNNIVNNVNEELSMEYIEKLVNQDFERYDDVFRRLA